MLNLLTIDLEDYFQVHAFSKVIQFDDWDKFQCRIERNADRLLEILNGVTDNSKITIQNSKLDHSITHSPNNSFTQRVHATFFVLGWIAERYPDLVRRIQKEGHEIACHGYAHRLVYTQSRDQFRQDVRKAKSILENITGSEVVGYRAPSYSITDKSKWAFEVLVEEGFKYDSSIFPIRHDFYGLPEAPRFPFVVSLNGNDNFECSVLNYESNEFSNSQLIIQNSQLEVNNTLTHSLINPSSEVSAPQHRSTFAPNNLFPHSLIDSRGLIEFPLSTIKVVGQNFPISGGGYFRLFPYSLIRRGLRRINGKEQKPFIFYIHPWELDFGQPRIKGVSPRSKFRHYVNLDKTEGRFRKLLIDFQFSTIRQFLTQKSI